jgi:molecular chaperone GrpE
MEHTKRKTPENGEEADNEIRVTDRRRVYLDEDGAQQSNTEAERPNLKPSYVEELENRTKAAEKQTLEIQARFDQLRQQLQRETDETRQRLNRAADERAASEKATFITSLLPAMDDLHRAIEAGAGGAQLDAMLKGLRGIATSFENALSNAGVETVPSIGEQFNPELHEAVDTAEAAPEMEGKVIGEYSRGFKIGNRLLRPARVKVGHASEQAKRARDSQ